MVETEVHLQESHIFFFGGAGESTDLSVIFTLGGSNFVLFYPKVLKVYFVFSSVV